MAWKVPDNRAILDLDHIATLASDPGFLLYVSETTLYVLQQFVAWDVEDINRYADEFLSNGDYVPAGEAPTRYTEYIDTVEMVQREVWPMPLGCEFGTVVIDDVDTYLIGTSGYVDVYVPAGERWVLGPIAIRNQSNGCKYYARVSDPVAGKDCLLTGYETAVANVWYAIPCNAELEEGMFLSVYFGEATDLDHVEVQYRVTVYDD